MEAVVDEKVLRKQIRAFVDAEIVPFANTWDQQERVPRELISKLAEKGFLGYTLPIPYGGQGMDQLSYGILNEEIGRGCSSVRSLITVHSSLVAETLNRWGTGEQKNNFLSLLAKGEKLAAFALSEPEVGSDAKNITTRFTETENAFLINGVKKWITFGQIADLFLVIARDDAGISAFLVDRDAPGLAVKPLYGMMGTRASMLAELHFTNCEVPKNNLLGKRGMGFLQIVNTALDNGRYSVACGSAGISRACLEESIRFSKTRRHGEIRLKDHQLTKQKITNMIAGLKSSQLLCRNAGLLRDEKDPSSIIQTSLAKYVASITATQISADAVQLHGALGVSGETNVQRYFRDARVMEIIEGSSEIQQLLIADQAFQHLESIIS